MSHTADRDLTVNTGTYRTFFAFQPFSLPVVFTYDNVAQEFSETAQIALRPTADGHPQGALGRLVLDIMIIDSDSKLKITLHMHILTNFNEFRMLPSHLINHLLTIQL